MVRHTGEDFIDEEDITLSSVLPLQSSSIQSAELDAPEANCFSGYSDASLGEKIFDIAVTEVESIIEPDGVRNDIRRETVSFVYIHRRIVSISVI